jgi:hypothetical protein
MEWNGMKWNENGIDAGSVANGIDAGSVAELTPSTKRQTHTRRLCASKSTRVIGGDLCRTSWVG